MSTGVFVIAWLLLMGGAVFIWLVLYPASQRENPLSRFAHTEWPDEIVQWRALCGVRYPLKSGGTMTVTMPLARVACSEHGLAICASSLLSRFAVPTWRFNWTDLDAAEAIAANGVRLRPKTIDAPIVLRLMAPRDSFLDILEQHGIEVDRRPKHFK